MPRSLLSGSPDTLSHLGLIGTMHEFLNDIFSGSQRDLRTRAIPILFLLLPPDARGRLLAPATGC